MPAITIPGGASTPELNAHLAVPPVRDGPWPAVVVLHEAFGLTDDIRQQADRLAAAGYLAVAPSLYSAGGVALHPGDVPLAAARRRGHGARRHRGDPRVGGDARRLHRPRRRDRLLHGRRLRAADRRPRLRRRGVQLRDAPEAARRRRSGAPARWSRATARRTASCAGRRASSRRRCRAPASSTTSRSTRTSATPSSTATTSARPAPLLRVIGVGYDGASAEDAWGRILRFFETHLSAPANTQVRSAT